LASVFAYTFYKVGGWIAVSNMKGKSTLSACKSIFKIRVKCTALYIFSYIELKETIKKNSILYS
jgi:hypothetical protein